MYRVAHDVYLCCNTCASVSRSKCGGYASPITVLVGSHTQTNTGARMTRVQHRRRAMARGQGGDDTCAFFSPPSVFRTRSVILRRRRCRRPPAPFGLSAFTCTTGDSPVLSCGRDDWLPLRRKKQKKKRND